MLPESPPVTNGPHQLRFCVHIPSPFFSKSSKLSSRSTVESWLENFREILCQIKMRKIQRRDFQSSIPILLDSSLRSDRVDSSLELVHCANELIFYFKERVSCWF
ncbi:hypothetical protein CEXT_560351 [Caerostris extrusa]|uniref:Uncharacterized protein n=1 Tax=Caerostris extrusa TaxID=172846 RepID=A0AAV4MJ67_CAEEX|nr:hypothetical protein CEXT_560351 [Caerostris extrusa]